MTNPRFTRRDFQFIADWIKSEPIGRCRCKAGERVTDRQRMTVSLANQLAQTNPNFDRERFIAAATPEIYISGL